MPATRGAAIEVPCRVAVAESDELDADRMPTPGAYTSRHEPKLLNEARSSVFDAVRNVAPTVMTDPADAGLYEHATEHELLVGNVTELKAQEEVVRRVASEVFAEKGDSVEYLVGTLR